MEVETVVFDMNHVHVENPSKSIQFFRIAWMCVYLCVAWYCRRNLSEIYRGSEIIIHAMLAQFEQYSTRMKWY